MCLTLPLILFLTLLALVTYHLYSKRAYHFLLFQRLGIPHPPPSLLDGNLSQIRNNLTTPMETMISWSKTYGPIYGYFTGTRPILVCHSLDLVKDILVKHSKQFIDRPHLVMNPEPVSNTLVGLRGQRWKQVRSTLSPIFSTTKIRHTSPLMGQCLKTTLKILSESQGSSIEVSQLFQGLTCDVISKCALGMEVNSQLDHGDRFLTAIKGFLDNAINPFVKVALCFPIVAKVAEWGVKKFGFSQEMTTMLVNSVRKSMDERRLQGHGNFHKNSKNSENEGKNYSDVLQFMLDASDDSTDKSQHRKLSDEEITANAWVFILGGFETTASALTFTSYLISKHEKIQERLFDEIQKAFGEDEIPSYEDLHKLIYLDQVISESLRLYPPVVTFISRHIEEQVQLGPYSIPSGQGINVQIPLWQIHHDPQHWKDPYKFDPERFNKSTKGQSHPMAYIPFGAGPRSCIGARFALLEIKLTLALILRKFRIVPEFPKSDEEVRLRVQTVALSPADGIRLKFIKRS